jgi:hypothetical protein
VLLLLSLPAVVQAQFTYITNNGALTIKAYTGPGGGVVIPKEVNGLPVTSIGNLAFALLYGLGSVTIPNSVTNIGVSAFNGCGGLTNVAIPDGVISIGASAFAFCDNLTNIAIPDSVGVIGEYAFKSCETLAAITIPDSVSSIQLATFFACISLSSVTIPDSVTSIGNYAFLGCSSLTNLTIPDSVTNIGVSAFDNCTSLSSVTIPDSVTGIGGGALDECSSLSSATIGSAVTYIGDYFFTACPKLTGVYFRGNRPDVGSSVFSGDNNPIVYYLPGTTGWSANFAGDPTALWNPQVQPGSLGLRTNQFGFNVTGSSNLVIVIEVSTNLANATWYPLQTNTLNGNPLYFSDPRWTNYGSRFYRMSWP